MDTILAQTPTIYTTEIATTTCDFYTPKAINKHALVGLNDIDDWKPFQFASSTCITMQQNATSTYPTFTYGEILISFFLFLMILGAVFGFIIRNFFGKLR